MLETLNKRYDRVFHIGNGSDVRNVEVICGTTLEKEERDGFTR